MKIKELTNCYGEIISIDEYLKIYQDGKLQEISDFLWEDLYHQGDIGTASITWIIEAHEIFLGLGKVDWNYLSFTAAIMRSIEYLKFMDCPKWLVGKYRPVAINALKYALSKLPDYSNEEQQLSILAITCAITRNYESYELMEYGWKYEEKLMELDI